MIGGCIIWGIPRVSRLRSNSRALGNRPRIMKRTTKRILRVWKFCYICGEMNLLEIFCIGRSEFVFFTLMVRSTVMVDIEFCTLFCCTFYWRWRNRTTIYFLSSLSTLICTENTVRIWICMATWKIKAFSISFTLFFTVKRTKESWEDRRIHLCDFERRNFVWHWLEKLFVLSLNDDSKSNVLKGIQNLELLTDVRETSQNMFWCLRCFNSFQTLKLIWTNKSCLDAKTFCDDMCFWSLLWSWQKDVNRRLRICFVSRSDTSTRTIAIWARHLSVLCGTCAELWEWLTWLRGRSFSVLRTTSWTLTQRRSTGEARICVSNFSWLFSGPKIDLLNDRQK